MRFVDRLAQDNGWARAFADDVYDEYLRFVYLMALGEGIRTPSDAVDQAWHLHLSYSESYWNDLCKRVLHTPLHHGPTRGGKNESAKYRDAYAKTLAAYEREFGHRPVPKIWPPVERRFGQLNRYQRVNTAGSFIVGKVSLLLGIAGIVAATAAVSSLLTASADEGTLRGALGTLALFIGIPVVGLIALAIASKFRGRGGGGGSGGACGGSSCGSGCGGGCGGS